MKQKPVIDYSAMVDHLGCKYQVSVVVIVLIVNVSFPLSFVLKPILINVASNVSLIQKKFNN